MHLLLHVNILGPTEVKTRAQASLAVPQPLARALAVRLAVTPGRRCCRRHLDLGSVGSDRIAESARHLSTEALVTEVLQNAAGPRTRRGPAG